MSDLAATEQRRCQDAYQAFLRENDIQDKGGLWRLWLAAFKAGVSAGAWREQSDPPTPGVRR